MRKRIAALVVAVAAAVSIPAAALADPPSNRPPSNRPPDKSHDNGNGNGNNSQQQQQQQQQQQDQSQSQHQCLIVIGLLEPATC